MYLLLFDVCYFRYSLQVLFLLYCTGIYICFYCLHVNATLASYSTIRLVSIIIVDILKSKFSRYKRLKLKFVWQTLLHTIINNAYKEEEELPNNGIYYIPLKRKNVCVG
jgi:hypothetical protein